MVEDSVTLGVVREGVTLDVVYGVLVRRDPGVRVEELGPEYGVLVVEGPE